MINACNQEIDNFLTSIPDIGEKDLNAIRTKYSSNITDVIVKGHITVSYTHLTLPTKA